ncbi:hypothetical protein TNCV_3542921 [Trichonephila clavipes]|nr:hypothetical protein TNCV_3542921 [Trichonephila clavipes]
MTLIQKSVFDKLNHVQLFPLNSTLSGYSKSKSSVELQYPSDLPKLEVVLKRLEKPNPMIQCITEEPGESQMKKDVPLKTYSDHLGLHKITNFKEGVRVFKMSRKKVFKTAEEAVEYLFLEELEFQMIALPPEVDELTDEGFDDTETLDSCVRDVAGNFCTL